MRIRLNLRMFLVGMFTFLALATTSAQAPFSTRIVDYWMDGYPIIFNNRGWKYFGSPKISTSLDSIPDDYRWIEDYDAIIEVNGHDVKGCTDLSPFFNESPHVTIKIRRWPTMEENIAEFDNLMFNPEHSTGEWLMLNMYSCRDNNLTVLRKSGLDFSKYRTYDFLITGDEPLVDAKILEKMMEKYPLARMVRDEEAPDVIFAVSKNAEQSISATYVPPTSETVNYGSTTRPVYNYLTRRTSYETRQHNKTIKHEGHTELTKSTSIYLEITALDAKKMFDLKQTTSPEIWKAVYSVSDVNDNRPILERYLLIAEKIQFPFDFSPLTVAYNLGIGADLESIDNGEKLLVRGVVPGGRADKLGLEAGDVITKINGKNKFKVMCKFVSGYNYGGSEKVSLGNLFYGNMGRSIIKCVGVAKEYKVGGDKRLERIYCSDLEKTQDEYTVERNGKKIKLIGKLYDPKATNIEIARFWDLIGNNPIYYLDFN